MGANLSFSATECVSARKEVSPQEISRLLKDIEKQSGWEVSEIVKNVHKNKADFISLNKEVPEISLFVRNGLLNLTIEFEKENKEMRVSIPKADADTLFGSL